MSLYAASGFAATFQCDRPAHDGVTTASPFFTFHAMTQVAGVIYDPSFGMIGAPTLTKFVPSAEDNAPTGNFPSAEDKDWNSNGIMDGAAALQIGTSLPPSQTNSWIP